MNYTTIRQVFAGAAVGQPGETIKLAGPSLTVQTTPGCTATIYGTNLPVDSASWQTIGTATGYGGTPLSSAFGFIRVTVDVAGTVAISATAAASSGGGGGGGTSNTTEATQLLVKAAVQAINTKTPELSGGKSPVTDTETRDLVQTTASRLGAADEAPAASDTTPSGLNGLVRRALQNWTTLLTRIPALVNGRTPVDTDRVVKQLIDAPSATVTYVCEANTVGAATSAAAWRIKRITVSGTTTTIQWGGTGAFDQIADNRATTVVYA